VSGQILGALLKILKRRKWQINVHLRKYIFH
jgi:hypothetical protein